MLDNVDAENPKNSMHGIAREVSIKRISEDENDQNKWGKDKCFSNKLVSLTTECKLCLKFFATMYNYIII